MERQLWKEIVAILAGLDKPRKSCREKFSDEQMVRVFYWSVIHDRPVCWACQRKNWPCQLRRQTLPSNSSMSRRLRSVGVKKLLDAVEQRLTKPTSAGLYCMIDGKPLVIGGCSKDRQAGYGRAASSQAKGYKLHALVDAQNCLVAWRVAPMNTDERVMAARLFKASELSGYIVADANYDSNPLHLICDTLGNRQLVTPRRYGPGRKVGHRSQSAGRLRSIELLENPCPQFGAQLMKQRAEIERYFGNATNWGGGLTHLPPWVRTHRRVRRWVQAKLALTALRRSIRNSTYAA